MVLEQRKYSGNLIGRFGRRSVKSSTRGGQKLRDLL